MSWLSSWKNKIKLKEPLAKHTTFRLGGPSDFWLEPENLEELKEVYKLAQTEKIPLFLLGAGSNLLVKDAGWAGLTLKLSSSYFQQISFNNNLVKVGAGQSLNNIVNFALLNSLTGSEFLYGIPGTLGGAVMVNAGAKDLFSDGKGQLRNLSNIVEEIKVLDKNSVVRTLKKNDIKFGYRRSGLNGYLILEASLRLNKGDKEKIKSLMDRFWEYKKNTQDFEHPNAGCVFKNPPGQAKSSGQLIDQAGFKGKKVGHAQVSLKHANFIINIGQAKASDVLTLMNDIQEKIKKDYNICLEPEIKIIGC